MPIQRLLREHELAVHIDLENAPDDGIMTTSAPGTLR